MLEPWEWCVYAIAQPERAVVVRAVTMAEARSLGATKLRMAWARVWVEVVRAQAQSVHSD